MRRLVVLALLLVLPIPALAQDDYPGLTMLYGTIDNDSLTVDCAAPYNGEMRCSFTQVMLSRVGKPEEFEKKLSDTVAQLMKEQQGEGFSKMCEEMAAMATAIRSGVALKETDMAKFRQGMEKMPQAQKDDLLEMFDLVAAVCANPNKQTAETYLRWQHDKETRTCRIWTNAYHQTFRSSDQGKTWIANEGPRGECGTVVISKWEKAKDVSDFWTYSTRKVVTNKDAKQLGVMDCSYLDEQVYLYDWKSDEKFLHCDYVKFGY